MPVEIHLLKINANGLERVLEANLTNLFGISNDDFLSLKQEKKWQPTLLLQETEKNSVKEND